LFLSRFEKTEDRLNLKPGPKNLHGEIVQVFSFLEKNGMDKSSVFGSIEDTKKNLL
jgi:hypothetical protein